MSTHYQERSQQVSTFAQIQTAKNRAEQSARSHEYTLPEPCRQVSTFAQIQTPKDRAEQSACSHEYTLPRILPTNHIRTNTNCKKIKTKTCCTISSFARIHTTKYTTRNPCLQVSTFAQIQTARNHADWSVRSEEYKLSGTMVPSQYVHNKENCQAPW